MWAPLKFINQRKKMKTKGWVRSVPSMNNVEFMEIYNHINFSFQNCFVRFMFLVKTIPSDLHFLCISALGGANKGLQVFILFNASVCIMWGVPHPPISNA